MNIIQQSFDIMNIPPTNEVFGPTDKAGTTSMQQIKRIRDGPDLAVDVIGEQDTRFLFFPFDQLPEGIDMQRHHLCERLLKHRETAGRTADCIKLHHPSFAAGQGTDPASRPFPEFGKPAEKILGVETEIAKNTSDAELVGKERMLGQVTHLIGAETIVPYTVDTQGFEGRSQGSEQ